MNTIRLTILLISLVTMLPMSALYYDPDGVENPLDSDITENVRYVTYECSSAKLANIISWDNNRLDWSTRTVAMYVIYCEDGTVYLNKFLNSIALISTSPACKKYWIKGVLSEDGRHINISVPQMVATDPLTFPQYLHPVILSTSDNENTVVVDDSTDTISFSIEEDGTLIPLGVDDTHGWGCFDSQLEKFKSVLFCDVFVPTETQPILPPPGLEKEDYDFKFDTYGFTSGGHINFGDIGKRVKIVFHNDSIFIQGCSYLSNEGWSVGRKDGDTYVFGHERQQSKNVRLTPIDFESVPVDNYNYDNFIIPLDDNVIFDNNPTSNSLTARSDFWTYGFTDKVNSVFIKPYTDNDIYRSAVFSKIPNGLQYPLPPDVKIEDYSRGKSRITVYGSYFDANGYIMDVKKLYYRLYIDGTPYIFTKVEKWPEFDLAEPTELLPYYLLNVGTDVKDTPNQYYFEIIIPSTFKDVKAELVYIQDGKEIGSGVDAVYTDADYPYGKNDVYDLSGRKIKADVLSPGIYIRGGQKFIVR